MDHTKKGGRIVCEWLLPNILNDKNLHAVFSLLWIVHNKEYMEQ